MMFNKYLIDLILAGKKTMASRDKMLYREGDITNLMANKDYSKISGKCIKFTRIYHQYLKNFTEDDAHKEGFQSLAQFKEYWNKNIGTWKEDKEVYVHEFELIDYDPKLFEDHPCDQCGSCCIQIKNIIETTREDTAKWVKECRADILQYCDGWYEELGNYLISGDQRELVDYFMKDLNMEMWFDPKTGDEVYLCPFLRKKHGAKQFECLIQDMKPSICKEYHCKPSKMLGIVKKPFDENLKEYRKRRRWNHSVASAPNRLEKA